MLVLEVGIIGAAGVSLSTTSGTVTATTLVLVVLVLGAELVGVLVAAGVLGVAGSSGGAGFCHTDCVVGAPRLGNRLSRIAYAAPADPTTTTAVTTAIDHAPVAHSDRSRRIGPDPMPPASPGSEGTRENTGGRRDGSSPCPWSSQSSLTTPL
jgi:hypothetical protein